MSDFRRSFDMSYGGGKYTVDPFSRELVLKTDRQGRSYRDRGDFKYSEEDLQSLGSFLDTIGDNPALERTYKGAIDRGYDPMQAKFLAEARYFVPIMNLEPTFYDVMNRLRDAQYAQEQGDTLGRLKNSSLAFGDILMSFIAPAGGAVKAGKYGVKKIRGLLE
jgi:hypothetical protein